MKLNVVPARTGMTWVRLGLQTFFRRPLAMAGLFFLFMSVLTLLSMLAGMVLPQLGSAVALVLLPATTLGLMAASRTAARGEMPQPSLLISAFSAGAERSRAMLVLGALYATGFVLVMGLSSLVDGGQFAGIYLGGQELTQEIARSGPFQLAMVLAVALYSVLAMIFWHAPPLVFWHGISPVKSLFFSAVACLRNLGAFTIYALLWAALFTAGTLMLATLAGLMGNPGIVLSALVPMALLLSAMFFASLYFTYRDCFDEAVPIADSDAAPSTPSTPD